MLRLRHFFPRGRALIWTLVALVVGPPMLLGLVLVLALAPGVSVKIDVGMVLFAVAAVLVAVSLFLIVRYLHRPAETVSVNYNFQVNQSALPLGRYTFRLEVFYEVTEKGRRETVKQGTIEMKFRAKDTTEFLMTCSTAVSEQLTQHGRMARERFPDHTVLLSPEPTARQIREKVES